MSATRLRHDAFFYDSDVDFAERMVPFVEEGLEDGESVVAVTTRANCALLRTSLGATAERVSFVDRDEWYVRPARTIAGYDRTLREHFRAGVPAVRVVGEVAFGATRREWAEWTAYEAILNRAFADQPAWIVCPYDSRVLPEPIVEDAVRTHSHDHDHEELIRTLTPDPTPLDLRAVPLDDTPRAFRERLLGELAAAGAGRGKAEDFVLAAGEVLSNARGHGEGSPRLGVGVVDGRFVCEISDEGPGLDDPLAGYMPPKPGDHGGAGLWAARQLTGSLDLIPSPDGFSVRLWL
jgi:anti-sigma regulatory factor (Ser/Thr protein kinase)